MSFLCSLVILAAVIGALDAGRIKCDYTYVKDAGGYFKFQEMPLTFDDAQQRCAMEGGVLASPITDNMKAAMTLTMILNNMNCSTELFPSEEGYKEEAMTNIKMAKKLKCAAFTGFSSKSGRGIFTSIERVHLSEVPHTWAPTEPDNYNNKENCIAMLANGIMGDVNCDEPLPYMCFIKEIKAKSLNACGPNRDYFYYSSTGSCYKFHQTRRVYDDAAKVCKEEGGHLLILNGDKEVETIMNAFFKNKSPTTTFIGFRYDHDLAKWMTLHGETIEEAGYAKWLPGEPNNLDNNQYCGNFYANGLLDDVYCDRHYNFICEKDPLTLLCN